MAGEVIKQWDPHVNTRVLREGANWGEVCGFIADQTRSGKVKRRKAHSQGKRPFVVKMRFTEEEYQYFSYWFQNTLEYGLYAFQFPRIDSTDNTLAVYRFVTDGEPQYSNETGKLIGCTMKWEEV